MKIAHIHVSDTDNRGDDAIVRAIQQEFRKLDSRIEVIDVPLESISLNFEAKLDVDVINSCDFVVIGGGGILYSYFLPYDSKAISLIEAPIYIVGVGYIKELGAQELSQLQTSSVESLFNLAALASVRDERTVQFIGDLKVQTPIELIGDPAILLEPKDSLALDKQKFNLGINLNYSGWLGFGQYQDAIFDAYHKIINHFSETEEVDVIYMLHHPGEKQILDKLNVEYRLIVDDTPEAMMGIYQQLDFMVGMMLHSCVMSYGAETPFLNIGYDIRNQSFSHFVGVDDGVVMADKLSDIDIVEQTSRLLNYYEKHHQEISMKRAAMRSDIKGFVHRIFEQQSR